MNKPKFFLTTVLFAVALAKCCAESIEEQFLNYSAVLIEIGSYSGTGFLLRSTNDYVYLVTAKHVLYNLQTTNTTPPLWDGNLKLTTYLWESKAPDVFTINLAVLNAMHEVRYDPNHDIAVVRLTPEPATNNYIYYWPRPILSLSQTTNGVMVVVLIPQTKKYDQVVSGTDVYLYGYPRSLYFPQHEQFDPNLPLMRKGTIAGKNPKRGTIILDCPVYHGNSGGPVVAKETVNVTTTTYSVIGIATEFVPSFESLEIRQVGNTNSLALNYPLNSGYSIVEPIDPILKLLWK